jgi:hypothetical protein
MNTTRTVTEDRPAPALFRAAAPEVNYREAETTLLERLKNQLLREKLTETENGELTVPLRRAANEAAALAWVTTHPLLLFPELFAEKARIARRQFERQIAVRARGRELMAA